MMIYESSILEYSFENYCFKRGYIRICRKVVPGKTGSNEGWEPDYEGWGSFAFLPVLGFLHQLQYQYQYQHLQLSISAGFLAPISLSVPFLIPISTHNKTQRQLCKRLAGPLIPFSWSCLVWKRVSLWLWSLGGSQQPFSSVLGHFWNGDERTTEQPGDPSVSLLLTSVRR